MASVCRHIRARRTTQHARKRLRRILHVTERPYAQNPSTRCSEDNGPLSSTTNMLDCHVDLNPDGQDFAVLRSEYRDSAHGSRRGHDDDSTTTFSTAGPNGTQHGNMQRTLRQRAAGAAAPRVAHATRSPLAARRARAAQGCATVGAQHHALGARHAPGTYMCVMGAIATAHACSR